MAGVPPHRWEEALNAGVRDQPEAVSAPAIQPWEPYPACPKCNHVLGAGVWPWRFFCRAKGESAHNVCYCRGDQNSTVQVPGLNMATMQPGTVQVPTLCFGLFEEHLHICCGRCGFNWIMACKERV